VAAGRNEEEELIMGAYPYRDASLEGEKLAVAAGMVPSAVRELTIRIIPTEGFRNVDADLINAKGETIEEFIERQRKDRPHFWASDEVIDEAEKAFGSHPTLAARGAFLKAFGSAVYNMTRDQWGASDSNLKPGIRPGPPDAKTGKAPDVSSPSNPWSKNFVGDDIERAARIASIIKAMGTSGAAALAKAAGTTIGRPLHKR
jgi:hypothetical protein